MDATATWPFPDASTSHIYSDNVIEHLRMAPVRTLLNQAHRVLRPGGTIRLVTPDVRTVVNLYLADDDETARHMAQASEGGYDVHHQVDLLRILFQEAGHHLGYLWDEPSLSAELEAAGFTEIARHEVGQSDDPILCGLEKRDSPIQLALEAVA